MLRSCLKAGPARKDALMAIELREDASKRRGKRAGQLIEVTDQRRPPEQGLAGDDAEQALSYSLADRFQLGRAIKDGSVGTVEPMARAVRPSSANAGWRNGRASNATPARPGLCHTATKRLNRRFCAPTINHPAGESLPPRSSPAPKS